MSKLRKKFIGILAVLFCAILVLSAALLIPKNKTAKANSLSNVIELGNDGKFSAKALRKLYGNIYSGATTYANLSSRLGNTQGEISRKFSEMTPTTVELGEYKWNLVAVSKNQQGDVIATLWLSTSAYTSTFSYSNFTAQAIDTYASSEYGMSLVRSTLVENAEYATSTTQKTNSDNVIYNQYWKTFISNYGSFIDAPYEVCGEGGYQATEKATPLGLLANLAPNDAYNKVEDGVIRGDDKVWVSASIEAVQHLADYGQWKNDKLWLPSLSETGYNTSSSGLWNIKNTSVLANSSAKTWLRSGGSGSLNNGFGLSNDGSGFDRPSTYNDYYAVRPALHLNLAKAANGVAFDAVELTNVQQGAQVANTETDHTFSRTYDDTKVEVKLLDSAKLDIVGPYVGNNEVQSEAQYQGGIFSVTNPKIDDDETYIIKVTPKSVGGKTYYWDDNDGSEARYYKIKITAAVINASWSTLSGRAVGDSVLQNLSANPITSSTLGSIPSFAEKYTVITDSSQYLDTTDTSKWDTTTTDWKARADGNTYFKVSSATTHRVFYEITANYHATKRWFYDVTVSADKAKFTAKSSNAVASEVYASQDAIDLATAQDTLKTLFGSNVTMTTTNNTTNWSSLSSKVDIKLFTKDSNGSRTNISIPTNGRLPAGDYYMYLDWSSTTDDSLKTIGLDNSENTYPKFEITPKPITVSIVEENGGVLTHEYGETPAKMKFSYSGLEQGDTEADLNLGSIVIDGKTHSVRQSTGAGTYTLTFEQFEVGNYKVTVNTCTYEVTKRHVKLQLEDEEMEYGKDFGGFKFKTPTTDSIVDGNIIDGDMLDGAIKSSTYSLKLNGMDVDETELFIDIYELFAIFDSDNYDFEVLPGKFTVTKANFDMSGVTFVSKGYVYDGDPHPAAISGTLPSTDITVSYRYVNTADGSESTEAPTEIGLYLVYASFNHSNGNYNAINDKVAYLRIAETQAEANQPFPALPTDEEIAAAANLAKKKAEAKKNLDEEASKNKSEIDSDANLTAEEKKAAKDKVDEELKKGNAAIDSATGTDGINKAYEEGKAEIEKSAELSKKKGAAKKSLEEEAKAKREEIENNPELTDEEKEAAKAKVDAELAAARKNVDESTSLDGVNQYLDEGREKISKIKAEHKDGSFPWWIIAVGAGALALLAVIIIVVLKRRNSEDDEEDYYDDEYDYADEEEYEDEGEDYGDDF